MQITLSINGIAVILLGILPGTLMTACLQAISQALPS
jgi:NADH-quinone oxidoreductase subunit N